MTMWSVKRMRGAAVLALATLALGPTATRAETLRVRSGEHAGFSRLVLDLPSGAGWALGRTDSGYELKFGRRDLEFELADIYRKISKDRLKAVLAIPGVGLAFDLDCTCHAKAFQTAGGALAIDFLDGPAPEGSPFEERTVPAQASAPPAEEPSAAASDGPSGPGAQAGEETSSEGAETAANFTMATPAAGDSRLALFLRDQHRTAPLALLAKQDKAAGIAPVERHTDGGATATIPRDPVPPNIPILPTFPSERISQAEIDLLHQLSRAAAQGLVEFSPSGHPKPAGIQAGSDVPPHAPEAGMTVPHAAPGISAQTSMDRDTIGGAPATALTSEGRECLEDALIRVSDWGDDRPYPDQIAEGRAGLVGEFDRPSPSAALSLARLYLFFGFGAEARALISAFDLTGDEAEITGVMAGIVDGAAPRRASPLSGQRSCQSDVALWALLATPDAVTAVDMEEAAVLRAFAALPVGLRRTLGPRLSDRFLATGAVDSARAVRDSVARVTDETDPGFGMIAARIDLADGDKKSGEARLDSIAGTNDPTSPEAVVLAIRSRLDRGETVGPALAENAGALAFEYRHSPIGQQLGAAHALALGSASDFASAFAALAPSGVLTERNFRQDTARRLLAMLVDRSDDAGFLRQYFSQRELIDEAEPDILLRTDIANRLSELGFAAEIRAILKGEAGYTDRGRTLLARAALAEFDPEAALGSLAGLTGKEALDLKARALAMAGDHKSASSTYRAAGQPVMASLQSWRGGDWANGLADAPAPIREAIASSTIGTGNGASGDDPAGSLEAGRSLVSQSRAAREKLDALLAATSAPADSGSRDGG